jgi:hypothetical protein
MIQEQVEHVARAFYEAELLEQRRFRRIHILQQ